MADFMKILAQAQEMQGKFQTLQDDLQKESVTASAGGGMVTVEANGQGTVRSIKIDPSVVNASARALFWFSDRKGRRFRHHYRP